MPNFKPKNSKKILIDEKNNNTLAIKHKEFLNEFYNEEQIIIPKLNNEIDKLKLELNNINLSIDKKLELLESIQKLKEERNLYKNKKKNYYLNNIQYIFEYFESKKNISEGNSNDKAKSLNSFFNICKEKEKDSNGSFNSVQKYFQNIDDSFFDTNNFIYPTDICQICKKGELIPVESEGIQVCNFVLIILNF